VVAKYQKIPIEPISRLYFFIFLTVIIFYGAWKVPLFSGDMLIPVIYFFTAFFLAGLFLFIGKFFLKDKTLNLLGLTVGTGNVGNLGVPLSIALFDIQAAAPASLSVVGFILYVNTIGFFIALKGKYNTKQALIKIIKLPALYSFALGIFLFVR